MKAMVLAAVLTTAACSQPMLATNLVFDDDGVAVSPALSGKVGGATVTIEP